MAVRGAASLPVAGTGISVRFGWSSNPAAVGVSRDARCVGCDAGVDPAVPSPALVSVGAGVASRSSSSCGGCGGGGARLASRRLDAFVDLRSGEATRRT